tara:strand:+ start:116 stop:262 length:147 start_codon:yes stop_codon:yes gene_type:complete
LCDARAIARHRQNAAIYIGRILGNLFAILGAVICGNAEALAGKRPAAY